jgi:hypothetical protein
VFICFTNILAAGIQSADTYFKSITLTMETGAEAKDDSAFDSKEHLKPLQIELRRLESLVEEIVDDMEYLKAREVRMRDTNGK